jgi:hypothetical protein
MRIWVHTGGEYNPEHSIQELDTSVDIILPEGTLFTPPCPDSVDLSPGSLGAPDDLPSASEILNFDTSFGPRQYTVLNIEYMTRAKFGAFATRASTTDYADIVFLIKILLVVSLPLALS